MRQPFETLPRWDDHFPKLRRGHGSTHTQPRFNAAGEKTRNSNPCVADGCKGSYSDGSKKTHVDQGANITDWKTLVKWKDR